MENETYPLSNSQKGMYYEWQKDKTLTRYNNPFLYDFPDSVQAERLREAFVKVVDAHPVLKLKLKLLKDDEISQYYIEDDPVEIPILSVHDQEVTDLAKRAIEPFDLLSGRPLFRIIIYKTENKVFAFIDIHHIIFDGTSSYIFIRDLAAAYSGKHLERETYTCCDFALKENERGHDERYEQEEAYFKKRLSGISMTQLPVTFHPDNETGVIGIVSDFVDSETVNDFCTRLKVSPNNLFAGALGICLNKYTRDNDIAFCTAHHGRIEENISNSIGMFVKTLPVTISISAENKIAAYLQTIRSDMKELWEMQTYPFADMARNLGASMELSYTYQKGVLEYFNMEGGQVKITYIHECTTTDKISVYIYQFPNQYEIRSEYNSALYDREFIRTFTTAIKTAALSILTSNPEAEALSSVSVVTGEMKEKLMTLSAGKQVPYNMHETFIDLFRNHARNMPDHIAVSDGTSSLTYSQLDMLSDNMAGILIDMGVGMNDFVAVMLSRTVRFVTCILAVQKAGAAYVPMDSEYPNDRLEYMLGDSCARLLITERALYESKKNDGRFDVENVLFADDPDCASGKVPHLPVTGPDTPAYMIYTSGSTGKPKGVVISHKSLRALIAWNRSDLKITSDDRICCHASFSFDASVQDLFPPLGLGAAVYIIPSELRQDMMGLYKFLTENNITGGTFSTVFGMEMVNQFELPLRYAMLGGEKLLPCKKRKIQIVNGYGPTEFTVCSNFHFVDQNKQTNNIPIGRPVPNSWSYVLDAGGQLLPAGTPGELCLSGMQISEGYWQREELTSLRFVPNPYSTCEENRMMYRTGDLVKWNEGGDLEFLGRIDSQVKLRGFRIELGEIETMMSTFEGIQGAVVDIKEFSGARHLCGYYIENGSCKVDESKLIEYLKAGLTEYMVPTAFMKMDAFPMTPNGKVNRKLLPVPHLAPVEMIPPGTEMEKTIFNAVSGILGTQEFGITTNLFSIGLTSILAIKLSVALNKQQNLLLQTKDILKLKTIKQMAAVTLPVATPETIPESAPAVLRESYPLTETQKGVYYDWEKNRYALQYNIPSALKCPGETDPRKLKEALTAVIDAHPYIKTILAIEDGYLVQKRRDSLIADIMIKQTTEEMMPAVCSHFVKPFNLFAENLFRFEIYRTEAHTWLLMDMHHIVFDGLSVSVFLNDLTRAFNEEPVAPEVFTAFDVALEEEKILASGRFAEAEAYFDRLMEGTAMSVFPPSPYVTAGSSAGESVAHIPTAQVNDFCRKYGVTVNAFFLSVLCQVVQRYTREPRVALTMASGGRSDNRLSNTFGMFVKTLPVVADCSKNMAFVEFARNIQEQTFSTIENEIFPYTRMVEKYGIVPQINYVYEGGLDLELALNGQKAEIRSLELDTVKFPFGIVVEPHGNHYSMTVQSDPKQYACNDTERFCHIFAVTASAMASSPELPARSFSLLDEQDRKQILDFSRGEELNYERQTTFIDLFRENVKKYPDRPAVKDSLGTLTYKELDSRSEVLAGALKAFGVTKDTYVAIMLTRRKEFIVSILAVQKAGGAYVPMDSEYPNDRLLYMLENSESKVLISERALFEAKRNEGDFQVKTVLFVDEFDFSQQITALLPAPAPEDLAYMIYTSGSTGKPKGVMIRHKSLRALTAWHLHDLQITCKDNHSAHPSFSFDASVDDLFPPLAAGACVHIIPSGMRQDMVELFNYMVENNISGGSFSTQFGLEMVNQFELPLRFIMMGGEKMVPAKKRNVKIVNGYGPTEFTVCSHYHIVDQDKNEENIPIGRPVPNTWSYVLDANKELMPVGLAGELCLSGIQIAKGYWKREDLTAEKFTDNPYATCPENAKIYRTGDLVRWNEQGELEYIGRIDNQVKLRGFRIELGEIESMMSKFKGILSAVADIKEIAGAQQLCAYYVVEPYGKVEREALVDYLKSGLTDYMVPAAFVEMKSFPLTPNGKVNRKALPLPQMARSVEYMAPTSKLEEEICQVFSELLRVEKVGILDNFFEIGGTSMSAIKAIIRIINLGHQLKYGDVFELKTPRAIASFLTESAQKQEKETQEDEDISRYDYSAINKILEQGLPDLWDGYADRKVGDVLLTGASGYLGIHLLRELIDSEEVVIYCMVRSKGVLTPERRLKSQLMYYFSKTFDDLFGTRIIPVDGDITNKGTLESLKGMGISTVYNCAASVKHYAAGNELEKINVEGVSNLIDFCRSDNARLIHISTISVSGVMNKSDYQNIIFNESKLFVGQKIENKYVLSKFKAERLLLQAITEGLDAKIMRVGNLMGRHSDGEFQINFRSNAFINMLKSYKVLQKFPLSRLTDPTEMSPIDCVAKAVYTLSKTPRNIVMLHAYNHYRLDMANVIYAMKEYGYNIELVSDNDFNEHFNQMMNNPQKSEYLSGLLHYGVSADTVPVPDDNRYTTLLLYKHQVRWPLADDCYSVKLVDMLDGMGFFDE